MEWHIDNDRPVYAQLVEQIQQAVVRGIYPPGQKLPGVRELAAEAEVNPNTMQRALATLEDTGLVYSQRTSGRFVTEDAALIDELRDTLATALARRFLKDMEALGCTKSETERYIRFAQEELNHGDTGM